jgi:hypothetical protein
VGRAGGFTFGQISGEKTVEQERQEVDKDYGSFNTSSRIKIITTQRL